MAPRRGVASPPHLECNVLIGQKGHKTKEERGKRKEKEKDGKKYKSKPLKRHHTWKTCTMPARRIIIRPKSTNNQHRAGYHS